MKVASTLSLFWVCLLVFSLFSCEENNVFNDLGQDLGEDVAGVYLEPGAGKLQAGTTNTREVKFWSKDDVFEYIGLWQQVGVYTTHGVIVSGASYEVNSYAEFSEWSEYREDNFSYGDWVPDERAYSRVVNYDIDPALDLTLETSGDITYSEFLSAIPEGYETGFYEFCASELTKSELNDLIAYGTMSQAEFDALYDESGLLTSEGKGQLITELSSIGMERLIGSSYEIETEYEVTIAYRVTNDTGIYNDSQRSFLVF